VNDPFVVYLDFYKDRGGEDRRLVGLHIGSDIKGLENVSPFIHSDTLFSAICHGWAALFGKIGVDGLLEEFTDGGEPPFVISSVFIYTGLEGDFFVPRPLMDVPGQRSSDLDTRGLFVRYAEDLKKVSFITLRNLREWLRRQDEEGSEHEGFYRALIEGDRRCRQYIYLDQYQSNEISRDFDHTNTFYRGRLFADESKFVRYYFLIRFSSRALDRHRDEQFGCVLSELAEVGIGGERSIGMGHFASDMDDLEDPDWQALLRESGGGNRSYLLSLYYPTDEEMEGIREEGTRYSLVLRKGWFDSPTGHQYKRKTVRMLSEGSVISLDKDGPLRGSLVDVSPEIWKDLSKNMGDRWHPIYRSGLGFALPV